MQHQVSLKQFNTFGIDVTATQFASFRSTNELKDQLAMATSPTMILGGGSNVLFTKNYPGTILQNNIGGIEITHESPTSVDLKVGAGVNWHEFVLHCVQNEWFGIENLSLIPGTVGASPIQNIGAYGVEVKDVITCVQYLDRATLAIKKLTNEECQFDYRNSIFKQKLKDTFVVTHVTFQLKKKASLNTTYGAINNVLAERGITTPTIKDISEAVIAIRSSKLPNPKEIGNAGSFFKNPVLTAAQFDQLRRVHTDIPSYPVAVNEIKVPAGWLIEQAGWKGKTVGKIGVHKNQALVIVNYGGGTGQEIVALANQIRTSVKDKFDIDITPEVNWV